MIYRGKGNVASVAVPDEMNPAGSPFSFSIATCEIRACLQPGLMGVMAAPAKLTDLALVCERAAQCA